MTRRFQNITPTVQSLPDGQLEPAEIVTFEDRVPRDVQVLASAGVLLELEAEAESAKQVASQGKGGKN